MEAKEKTKEQRIKEIADLRKKYVDYNLTEEAISSDEILYRNIVENQTEFMVRWLPDGIRTFVNDSYCRYFGISREEAIGSSFFPHIFEMDRKALDNKFAVLTPENPVAVGERRVIRPDGTIGWNSWAYRAFFEANEQLIEFQSVGSDITERRRAEKHLREGKEKHRLLFETITQSVVYQDANGNIISANPAAEKLLGLSFDRLMGRTSVDPRWKAIHEDIAVVWEHLGLPVWYARPCLKKDRIRTMLKPDLTRAEGGMS